MAVRLAALVALAACLAAPAAAIAGGTNGIGVRLLSRPGPTTSNARARSYIIETVAPGTTITRRVEISNTTSRPAPLVVSTGAAVVRHGVFAFAAATQSSELVRWSTVSTRAVTLSPGHAATVGVTIAVPKSARAGRRYGVVWAAMSGAPAGGVREVNRVGVRIYLSVGPGGTPPHTHTRAAVSRRPVLSTPSPVAVSPSASNERWRRQLAIGVALVAALAVIAAFAVVASRRPPGTRVG